MNKFISEPISVSFSIPPTQTKKPHCPDRFNWGGEEWIITTCLSEWVDFARHGRMAQNMQPHHARIASKRGSWGVGRFFFEVQTHNDRFFRLYYDRAPENANDRTGQWILLAELEKGEI